MAFWEVEELQTVENYSDVCTNLHGIDQRASNNKKKRSEQKEIFKVFFVLEYDHKKIFNDFLGILGSEYFVSRFYAPPLGAMDFQGNDKRNESAIF